MGREAAMGVPRVIMESRFRYACLVGVRDWQATWTPTTWICVWIVRVCTGATMWALLGELTGSGEVAERVLVGQMFVVGAAAVSWAIPAAAWDRMDGTFDPLSVVPGSYFVVLLGRTSIWLVSGIATAFVSAGVLMLVFPSALLLSATWMLAIGLVASCFSAYCFALAHGALSATWPGIRNFLLGIVTIELTILTGAMVPVSYLSGWLQRIVVMLPLSHSIQSIHDAASGSIGAFWTQTALEVLVGLSWLVVAALVTKHITRRKSA